jgi:hypothetical protein
MFPLRVIEKLEKFPITYYVLQYEANAEAREWILKQDRKSLKRLESYLWGLGQTVCRKCLCLMEPTTTTDGLCDCCAAEKI